MEGAHPFAAIALVGGDVAVKLHDVAPVARMAPGAVLLRAHDIEQVPRGENPTLAVEHHVRADGGGALALRGAAGDDHRAGEARGNGNGLAEHPLGSINVPGEGAPCARGPRGRRKLSSPRLRRHAPEPEHHPFPTRWSSLRAPHPRRCGPLQPAPLSEGAKVDARRREPDARAVPRAELQRDLLVPVGQDLFP